MKYLNLHKILWYLLVLVYTICEAVFVGIDVLLHIIWNFELPHDMWYVEHEKYGDKTFMDTVRRRYRILFPKAKAHDGPDMKYGPLYCPEGVWWDVEKRTAFFRELNEEIIKEYEAERQLRQKEYERNHPIKAFLRKCFNNWGGKRIMEFLIG